MNSKKFLLGLVSSLLLAVGFVKASELSDPLQASLKDQASVDSGTAPLCEFPCSIVGS